MLARQSTERGADNVNQGHIVYCFLLHRAGFRENMGTPRSMLGKESKYGAEEYS